MAWNPAPEVAVAREAAAKLNADIGCIIIYLGQGGIGMASYGVNKRLCDELGKLGDHLHAEAMSWFNE